MIDLFIKGGVLMYPLLLCSIISVAVIIEKGMIFFGSKARKGFDGEVVDFVRCGKIHQALEKIDTTKSPIASIIAEALQNHELAAGRPAGDTPPELSPLRGSRPPGPPAGAAPDRGALETKISQAGSVELKRLTRHLHYLELIGKVAPMIGLSGTVLGLARTFQTVASTRGFADASLLAGGIWEALITTVAGLFIAIPALIFYHLYDNGIRSLAHEMKIVGEETIVALEGLRDRV